MAILRPDIIGRLAEMNAYHIVDKILGQLSPTSLKQCRLVSKGWNSIASTYLFPQTKLAKVKKMIPF